MAISLKYFDLLSPILMGYENDTMKAIMYVAVFVVCMFIISGVLKRQSANSSAKPTLEEFLKYLKKGDFDSLNNQYPGFIQFGEVSSTSAFETREEIRRQQRIAFENARMKFSFKNLSHIRIEKVIKKPFQYEQRTDIAVTGLIFYHNGYTINFKAVLLQNKMYSLMIGDECVLNDRCMDY